MINNVNPRGTSFKGVAAYLMNGERGAENPDRVAFTATSDNLGGVNIECAAKMMAYNDMSRDQSGAGRKSTKGAVFHFSLSWAKDESPNHQHQEQTGHAAVKRLKLQDHEYFIVGHNDKTHDHIHIVVNLTHPETLKRGAAQWSHRALSDFARQYEREHGMKCEAREENRKRHKNGEHTKHQDEKQDYAAKVTVAFERADNGKSFIHALKEQGLELGRAKRGNSYVIVDGQGNVQSLSRQLEIKERHGAKTKAINSKLSDLQKNDVQDGDEIAGRIKKRIAEISREDHTTNQQNALLNAAHAHAKKVAAAEAATEKKNRAREYARNLAFKGRILKMEKRHERENTALEKSLSDGALAHLKQIKADANKLQTTIEGRGFGRSLRRLWRGRKDRENLEQMQQNIRQFDAAIKESRDRIKHIHEKEREQLHKDHEAARYNFAKAAPEQRIAHLERQKQKRQELHKQRGQDRPAVHLNDREQIRTQNRIAAIYEAEADKQKQAATARQQAAQYPDFVKRQQEIDAQPKLDHIQENRISEVADQIREALREARQAENQRQDRGLKNE